jgi:hypothetical protein
MEDLRDVFDGGGPIFPRLLLLLRQGRPVLLLRHGRPKASIPSWALGLMAAKDAQRYTWEWGAHLRELIEDGEGRQARRDRRRLIVAAITIAIALRVRRALGRAH